MSDMDIETNKTTVLETADQSTVVLGSPFQEESANAENVLNENEFPEKSCVEGEDANPTENESVQIFQQGIDLLDEKITVLEKLFETKILHTEHEEKIVDQMHRELQKYKEDMYSQLVRPILLDIIEIRDSILRVSGAHWNKTEGEQSVPLKTFEMYASDIQEILEKNNIEIFKSEEKSDFVPVQQRAIKKVSTSDQNLHGKVAESLSDGYSYLGRIISAEKIAVFFFEPQPTQVEPINEEEQQNG